MQGLQIIIVVLILCLERFQRSYEWPLKGTVRQILTLTILFYSILQIFYSILFYSVFSILYSIL